MTLSCYSLWTYIAEIFNRETGKLASVEKLRKLFTRLKDQKKKVDRYSQVSIFSMLAFQIHDSRRLEDHGTTRSVGRLVVE